MSEPTTTYASTPLHLSLAALQQQANAAMEHEDWEAAASLLEKASDLCWMLLKRAESAVRP